MIVSNVLISILTQISRFIDVFPILSELFGHLVPSQSAIYEVLSFEASLEICDIKGKTCIYRKQQQVKFLQDNIIAYQDQVFGEGNIFANYECSPSTPVDHYLNGDIYYVLISLRETKNRGDVEDIYVKRTITNGFKRKRGYFQNRVNHPMRHFSTSVIFPAERLPRNLCVVEHNRKHVAPLSQANIRELPDKRVEVTWETNRPRLHEMYSIRWDW